MLATAHDAYLELKGNLEEGTKVRRGEMEGMG